MSFEMFLQHCFNALTLGSLYALIAIGYTMVYGILRLINFAHGDVFMVAGLMMVYLTASLPLAASIPLVLALTVVTNIITEVLKKLTWDKLPTNIVAFLVAMVVTLLAFFAVCQIAGIAIVWYMVVGAIVLGIFVAYAAMFGFDKLKQTLEQLNGIRSNK